MQFAIALPWWALLLVAAAVGLVAWGCYAGAVVSLPPRRRAALSALRALTLLLLVACLLRPVRVVPPAASTDAVVPILVDASRSMRLADMDGRTRIDAARDLLAREVRPALAGRFVPELWTFGNTLEQVTAGPVTADAGLTADAGRSDLSGALRALRDRYRERRVAAIVIISDGGDTGAQDAATSVDAGVVPVFAIGVGAPRVASDLEVLDVSAGETTLADSSVDISVAAVSRGGADPFDLRVLENGRPVDIRRMVPAADGGPVRAVFTVSPPRDTATLYTVEIPSAAGERVLENNTRTVLVEPPGRRHRILMIEGAPGFEHSFIKRALVTDPGLELDSVVRKGRDARGAATYFVQATAARASRLATGFPQEREALYEYDALVLANVEPDGLSRAQLQMIADFVDVRGGGLLVLGARSFVQQGFAGTSLEDVLPLRLTDRGSGVVPVSTRPAADLDAYPGTYPDAYPDAKFGVTLTADGQSHPVMRIGGPGDMTTRWAAVPPLSGAAALGALRPGAQALALVRMPDGPRPLVAVQRYGQGRSMVFTGEASWRWRMQMPSADRTHEFFWRQAARWITAGAPDRVSIAPQPAIVPGSAATIGVDVRDTAFAPVSDARVTLHVTLPGGAGRDVHATLADPQSGRYSAELRFDEPGIYRVTAAARRGGAVSANAASADAVSAGAVPGGTVSPGVVSGGIVHGGIVSGGTASGGIASGSAASDVAARWILVGGTDFEMADPRLNEQVLRRVATASGGSYLAAHEAGQLSTLLASAGPEPSAPQLQELWHNVWIFAGVMLLLAAEWTLRRRWGLR